MNDSAKQGELFPTQEHMDHPPRWQTLLMQALSQKGLSLPTTRLSKVAMPSVQQACEWPSLSSIAQIIKGRNLSSYGAGRTPIVQGRDLRVDRIDVASLTRKDLTTCPYLFPTTETGDILLQKIGSRPAAYMVSEPESGIAVSETIFIVRLIEPDLCYARFLTAYFNSPHGRAHLTQNIHAAVVTTQSMRHLDQVTVPRPDPLIQQLLIEATNFERQLRHEYESAAAYCERLFALVDSADKD